jgi:hypothetical protein
VTRLPDWPVVEPGEHVEGCVLGDRHLGACQNTVSAGEPVGELRCLHGQCVEAKAYGKHAQGYTDDDIDRLVGRAKAADERAARAEQAQLAAVQATVAAEEREAAAADRATRAEDALAAIRAQVAHDVERFSRLGASEMGSGPWTTRAAVTRDYLKLVDDAIAAVRGVS